MKPRNPAFASLNRPPEVWGIDVGGANLNCAAPVVGVRLRLFRCGPITNGGTAVQQLISVNMQ